MVDGYSEYEYEQHLKSYFMEELAYGWSCLSEDEYENWGAESVWEGLDYAGRSHEIIDNAVPVYTYSAISTWLNLGMPEAEDYGLENSGTIVEQVMAGIYLWADAYVRENFENWHEEFVHSKTQVTTEDA